MTTEHVAAHTTHADPRAAGEDLAQQINRGFSGPPDAILLFNPAGLLILESWR